MLPSVSLFISFLGKSSFQPKDERPDLQAGAIDFEPAIPLVPEQLTVLVLPFSYLTCIVFSQAHTVSVKITFLNECTDCISIDIFHFT